MTKDEVQANITAFIEDKRLCGEKKILYKDFAAMFNCNYNYHYFDHKVRAFAYWSLTDVIMFANYWGCTVDEILFYKKDETKPAPVRRKYTRRKEKVDERIIV